MNIKDKIGQRIRDARKKLGITREQLAELTKTLNAPRIGNWERGQRSPGPDEVMRLAQALKVSPSYLYCLTDHDDTEEKFTKFIKLKTVPILNFEEAADYDKKITDDPYTLLEKYDHVVVDDQTASKLTKKSFAVKLVDESMAPLFQSQDIIVVAPGAAPKPGQFVLAKTRDSDQVIFRKYRELGKSTAGSVKFELLPLNDDWPSVIINSEKEGIIIGVMIELRRYA